jgi:hypothetical protein
MEEPEKALLAPPALAWEDLQRMRQAMHRQFELTYAVALLRGDLAMAARLAQAAKEMDEVPGTQEDGMAGN